MIKQHREVPDLIQLIADLNKRISTLESANSLGSASIDGGELTVRGGDIVVRNDNDEEVLRIAHGQVPQIILHPDAGLDDLYSVVYSWESVSQGAALQASIHNSTGDQDGGKLLLMKGATYLSHQPDGPAAETYMALSEYDPFPNYISFKGLFLQNRYRGDEPWEMGYDSIAAGFGAISYAFAYPYDQVPQIIYSISGATANFNHCIVSPSTTGFTIGWSDALAHTVSWVAIRR